MTGYGYGTRVIPPPKRPPLKPRASRKKKAGATSPSWDVSERDRLLAGHDVRQMHFAFYESTDEVPELNTQQAKGLAEAAGSSL